VTGADANTGRDAAAGIVTALRAVTKRRKRGSKNSEVERCRFTVPRELALMLRDCGETHQREGYRCLFDASSQSIRDVGAATRTLRDCKLGYFGVLHTWGRDLQTFHPHVHYVVPGGGVKVDHDGNALRWQSTPKNFFVHGKTLSRVYKAKLADALREAELYDQVPASAWYKDFVVDIRPVGHAEPTLKYLAPYVHRVAISDKRIVSIDESSVKYTVRPSKSNRTVTRTPTGVKFVGAFAQHILPSGFMKIRHYGWMSANSKITIDEVKWLVWLHLGWTFWLASGHAPQEKPLTTPLHCAACGGEMKVVAVTYDSVVIDSTAQSLTYFDSG
jgi:hypothetical protein